MENLQPSLEQQNIINLLNDYNVIVDSVAGCGKTTTNLFIAKHYSNLNILLLTYNSKLKIETKERVKLHNINNLDVFSYHSFTVKYYNSKGYTDKIIKDTITNNLEPKFKYNYDLIIIDEAQDLTPLYYELVCKIYKDNNNKNVKICLLGDVHQSIYQFNNADGRYLIYSDRLFNLNGYGWKKSNLSYSFRITNEMANFVNNCVFDYDKVLSNKISNVKPKYYMCNSYNDNCILKEILNFINKGYKYDDIFVLAPSIKSEKTPIRNLENKIKNSYPNINVYVPSSDEEEIDKTIIENKIVFSTFHQTKGLERKVVIVFNFDYSYFKFFSKNKNPDVCPNEIYVAITRAKEHLILIHDNKQDFLPFLNKNKLHSYVNIMGKLYFTNFDNNKVSKSIDTKATDLVNHLPYDQILKCLEYLQINQIRQKSDMIKISTKTKEDHGFESVSEITGTAIPLYYEYLLKGKVVLKNNNFYEIINNCSKENLLKITNNWCSHKSGYIFKNTQITNYDWLTDKMLDSCVNRLKSLDISGDVKFEQELKHTVLNRNIIGYYDCLNIRRGASLANNSEHHKHREVNNFYEFKCVKEIKNEHYIQLAIYAYLYEVNNNNVISKLQDETVELNKLQNDFDALMRINDIETKISDLKAQTNYYLYNILSDELFQINFTFENLETMVHNLIHYKYYNNHDMNDDVFLEKNLAILQKYLSL
jgi:hypothetical protein